MKHIFEQARIAARKLALADTATINNILLTLADDVEANIPTILEANIRDLARMDESNPKYDRLKLTDARIRSMADGVRQVALLPSPLGITLEHTVRPNGMRLDKVSVPFGVIGIVYEARPNVTLDVFALCLKSGNACILKGGSDADDSNKAIVKVIADTLRKSGALPVEVVTLLPPGRESTEQLLKARGYVDLIIPRGGKALIDYVRNESTVPVIETGAGVCHTYFDRDADTKIGAEIVCNAKTRRVSVCNALDCLLVHRDRVGDIPQLCAPLAPHNVKIYADAVSLNALEGNYPATLLAAADSDTYGTEFLDYKMAIKVVSDLEEAVMQIARYGSGHSECIVTENAEAADYFCRAVDAACVYVNVPTSFTDGGEFGLGAEIGISTQKLHARGPMGLRELTTYKWLIHGEGQLRP